MTDLSVERQEHEHRDGADAEAAELPSWLAAAGVAEGRGLEIGPLDKPRLAKPRYRVEYVDHASTADLRAKYADDAPMADHLDEIVEVDHVWSGSRPLADVVGDAAPYDYVVASHVVEHVADMIGWLGQIADVLVDGGRLCLAVPDKRLCFDVNRDLTTMADLVDAHLRALDAPGYRQIYDFHSRIVAVDAAALWAGSADYSGAWRTDVDPDEWAYELCLRHERTGEYVDGHCQVFTPSSFLDLFGRLAKLGLIGYRIASFEPPVVGSIEFRAVLEKLPPSTPADERTAMQLASIPTFADPVPPAPAAARSTAAAATAPEVVILAVSPREASLIRSKRRVIERVRGLLPRRSG